MDNLIGMAVFTEVLDAASFAGAVDTATWRHPLPANGLYVAWSIERCAA